MMSGSEKSSAKFADEPNIAPMRSAYFVTYSGTWSAAGVSGECVAVPSMRMMSRPMSVTSRPSATRGFSRMFLSLTFAFWLYMRIVSSSRSRNQTGTLTG